MTVDTSTSPRALLHLRRAACIADLADRLSDRILPASADSGPGATITLYREAAYWALTTEQAGLDSPWQAFEAADRRALLEAAGDERTLAQAREALKQPFNVTAELSEAQQVQQRDALRHLVRALIDRASLSDARRIARRRLGTGLAAGALAVALGGALSWMSHRDLAAGCPWRASSIDPGCDPQLRFCSGQVVDVFFHTAEEDSPWVEIDLGKARTFSSVTVTNRQDCCQDRAVPLAIEISDDQTHFTQVAKRDDSFLVWKATFDRVRGRYVRARSLRRTFLHLERISVQ
jgi:hypothetical protein